MKTNKFGKAWIVENSKAVLKTYSDALTLRQLYYRLVAIGMPNNLNQYKAVVSAMTDARWDGNVSMEAFIDRERSMYGETRADEHEVEVEIERAKQQIKAWMSNYRLEVWSNQPEYVEVWIEKKALQGVLEMPCLRASVGLAPCKGYPSLTFLNEAAARFREAADKGKILTIIYFGDYDPSGEDIPRSIRENLRRLGVNVDVERVALNAELIEELGLPGVPPKSTDSRSAAWSGNEAVELDAVEPETLAKMCAEAIAVHFSDSKNAELNEREETEKAEYRKELVKFVNEIAGGSA